MADKIEFQEEESVYQDPNDPNQSSFFLTRWILKKGIAKTREGANKVLLIVVAVAVIVSFIALVFIDDGGRSEGNLNEIAEEFPEVLDSN